MPSITDLKIENLSYDSSRGAANYTINCKVDGTHANVFGVVPVKTPGDQRESEVKAASKAALADFFEALSAQVRSSP